jgi:hypothetical protein
MTALSLVLGYERPLIPGTVRITRGDAGAVTVAIAPDTARRTIYTLSRPLILGLIFSAIPFAIIDHSMLLREWGIVGFVLIALFTARACFRIIARSNQPIIFRADAAGIQIVNPLDDPASQFYGPAEIIALQLNQISLVGRPDCYQLELRVRTFWRKTDQQTLLVSQSGETLDKVGRTLCTALALPEPQDDARSWTSYRPPVQTATISNE